MVEREKGNFYSFYISKYKNIDKYKYNYNGIKASIWVQESGLSGSGPDYVNIDYLIYIFLTFHCGRKNRFLFIHIIQNIGTLINIITTMV